MIKLPTLLLPLLLPISLQADFLPENLQLTLLGENLGWLEGPAWDASEQALYFSRQTDSGIIYRWTAEGGVQTFRTFNYKVNGNVIDHEGRLINCESSTAASKDSRRLVRYENEGGTTVLVDNLNGETLNQPNDVIVDSQGRLWFTTPSWNQGEQARQFILRHDPQTGVTANLASLDKCNGLGLSPDEKTLYVVTWGDQFSTTNNKVVAYTVADDGSLGNRRDLITGLMHGLTAWRSTVGATSSSWSPPARNARADPRSEGNSSARSAARRNEQSHQLLLRRRQRATLFITAGTSLFSVDLSELYFYGATLKATPERGHGSPARWLHLFEDSEWVFCWSMEASPTSPSPAWATRGAGSTWRGNRFGLIVPA
jgi:gluconolactonase